MHRISLVFTLIALHGHPVTLSSLRGRYALLDFWASWCKLYRAENPHVLATYQRFRDRSAGFKALSAPLNEKSATWQQAVQQNGLPWPRAADPRPSIGHLYRMGVFQPSAG